MWTPRQQLDLVTQSAQNTGEVGERKWDATKHESIWLPVGCLLSQLGIRSTASLSVSALEGPWANRAVQRADRLPGEERQLRYRLADAGPE